MHRSLACLILAAAFVFPAAAQDDADDFGETLVAAAKNRCRENEACVRRQMDAFDRLIGLEPDSAEEVTFRGCVGTPLPSDADWEKVEQCVSDNMKVSAPSRS